MGVGRKSRHLDLELEHLKTDQSSAALKQHRDLSLCSNYQPLGRATGAVAPGRGTGWQSWEDTVISPHTSPYSQAATSAADFSSSAAVFFFLLPLSESLLPLPFLSGCCLASGASGSSPSLGLGHGMGRLLRRAPLGGGGDLAAGAGLPLSPPSSAWCVRLQRSVQRRPRHAR